MPFWQNEYLGNSAWEYAITLAIFLGLFLFFKIFQSIILYRLKKLTERTKSDIDDELIKIIRTIKPPFYSFLSLYLALHYLTLNPFLAKTIYVILVVWFAYQVITAVQVLINYVVQKHFSEEDNQSRTAISVVSMIVKGSLWVVALLMILANLGVNITSLIAGLGVGGIAIAMAIKNILTDLLASLTIYFDRPFIVGDKIVMGDTEGVVQKIGIKTTRIKGLEGEEIIIPNGKLTSSVVVKK